MKTTKKFLALLLAVIISLSCMSFCTLASTGGDKVANYAKACANGTYGNFVYGSPYVCSTFIDYVYKKCGFTITNSTQKLINGSGYSTDWKQITKAELEPGDILCWKGKHVALFVGDNKCANMSNYSNYSNDVRLEKVYGSTNAYMEGSMGTPTCFRYKNFGTAGGSSTSVITWNRIYVENITETSAVVKTDVTCTPSQIKKIGLQMGKASNSMTSVASWNVNSILDYCYVKCDGSEAAKLSPDTTYYYRFYIIKNDGSYVYSPTNNFKTKTPMPATPSNPNLNKTVLTVGDSITFSWNSVSYASSYRIVIYNGTKTVLDTDVGNRTNYAYTPTSEGTYYFTVYAKNSAGTSSSTNKISAIVNAVPTVPDVPETPDEPETPEVKNCSCNCHKGGISGLFFKIINFFQKLFGMNKTCACGAAH